MTILSSPVTILIFVAAAVLTAVSACVKKLFWLQYIGGFVFAAGVVAALVSGCGLQEIVVVTLFMLLLCAALRKRGDGG